MKKKWLFIILLCALLTVCSISVNSCYDTIQQSNKTYATDELNNYMENTLPILSIYLAMENDSTYDPIVIDEDLPEEVQDLLYDQVEEDIKNIADELLDDPYLDYTIVTSSNKTSYQNNELDEDNVTEDQCLYGVIEYDSKGKLTSDGTLHYNSDLLEAFINLNNTITEFYDEETETSYDYLELLSNHSVTLAAPANTTIYYRIPETMTMDYSSTVALYLNVDADYHSFTTMVLLISSFFVVVFMLIYPIQIVQDIQPYRFFRSQKGEINLAMIIFLCASGIAVLYVLVDITLNQNILSYTYFDISFTNRTLSILNYIGWFVVLGIISIAVFDIKYILNYGIGRYLKEQTIIGHLYYWLKDRIIEIMNIDFNEKATIQIGKMVLLNLIVIAICCLFGKFGIVLALIYTLIVFVYCVRQLNKVQKDYHVLTRYAHELSLGHFNHEIPVELGAFDSLRDEFNQIQDGFEKAVQEEVKSQNMKTELITNVSHDLKTPLTGIKSYVELLQDPSLDEETRMEYITQLDQYSNRLEILMEDLFEVSKVNSGDISLELMELDIVALIKQVQAEYDEQFAKQQLQCIFYSNPDSIPLLLDSHKTYRIIENLMVNITKYALPNTRVYIEIVEEDTEIRITFKNISMTQMDFSPDEIVERFVRGDKSRHTSGSGLGLAIVQSFTEAQGGRLNIEIDGDLFKASIYFPKQINETA